MTDIQRLAGMQDVLPAERPYWESVITAAEETARLFAFERLDIPIIENTALFEHGVGTGSDFFVQKEMYTIEEEDGDSITLRPEFTAGVVRAYIENGLTNETQPVKVYSIGPIFRRERPQAGRFRQASQLNCEILGEIDPAADAEAITFALSHLHRVGLRGLSVQLNSTGCRQCKPAYIEKLRAYLQARPEKLSPVDEERLRRNPLRVLDSKEAGMDAVLAEAPHIADHLCADCAAHFADLLEVLDRLGVDYRQNFRLVRGIDYYVKTVFEVWAEGIGAQAALLGGGRYDGLSEAIGGPPTPGVGFASGVERVALAMQEQGIGAALPSPPLAMVVHFGGATKLSAIALAQELRMGGISTFFAFARERRSMKSQMREADKRQVRYTLIVGDDEVVRDVVAVRPMDGGEQTVVPRAEIVGWLRRASEG
ncbi:MAG: histidine--tRNA ligase [Anaerolineae bacterium]|nr:histidine--tRNA ligase [Anaerolineae bacterium]